MGLRGLTQAELARRVRITQGAIAKIANKDPTGSSHLHKIARELGTTPAYLVGEIDDPDEGASQPPPEPVLRLISMPVAIPSENVLARMFEGLLETIDLAAPKDEVARTLAQRLPTGLSRLRGLLLEPESPLIEPADEAVADLPTPRRAARPGRRT